jgi:hypothetical protein
MRNGYLNPEIILIKFDEKKISILKRNIKIIELKLYYLIIKW